MATAKTDKPKKEDNPFDKKFQTKYYYCADKLLSGKKVSFDDLYDAVAAHSADGSGLSPRSLGVVKKELAKKGYVLDQKYDEERGTTYVCRKGTPTEVKKARAGASPSSDTKATTKKAAGKEAPKPKVKLKKKLPKKQTRPKAA